MRNTEEQREHAREEYWADQRLAIELLDQMTDLLKEGAERIASLSQNLGEHDVWSVHLELQAIRELFR